MNKYMFFIILFLCAVTAIPSYAKDCFVVGRPEDIVNEINLGGELFAYMGYKTTSKIDTKKCAYEIISKDTGVYTCHVNQYVELDIFTDKYMNAKALKIYGPVQNGVPKETTVDWAFVIMSQACGSLYYDDLQNLFGTVLKNSYYADRNVEMCGGIEPDTNNRIWSFIVANK